MPIPHSPRHRPFHLLGSENRRHLMKGRSGVRTRPDHLPVAQAAAGLVPSSQAKSFSRARSATSLAWPRSYSFSSTRTRSWLMFAIHLIHGPVYHNRPALSTTSEAVRCLYYSFVVFLCRFVFWIIQGSTFRTASNQTSNPGRPDRVHFPNSEPNFAGHSPVSGASAAYSSHSAAAGFDPNQA